MNSVLVLVMLILVIFALKEGMLWVALGIGLVMVLVATSEDKTPDPSKMQRQLLYPPSDLGPVSDGMKEQMLRVKYQPKWDGNNWWEEIADHWGTSLGRTIGLLR